jgi:hypothetical protein
LQKQGKEKLTWFVGGEVDGYGALVGQSSFLPLCFCFHLFLLLVFLLSGFWVFPSSASLALLFCVFSLFFSSP